MNTENEFDALAREKLEGRSIPFEEKDWTQMQAVLDAHNKRKKRAGFWFGGAAVLLLLIGGVWYLNGPDANDEKGRNALADVKTEQASKKINDSSTPVSNEEVHAGSTNSWSDSIAHGEEHSGVTISAPIGSTKNGSRAIEEMTLVKYEKRTTTGSNDSLNEKKKSAQISVDANGSLNASFTAPKRPMGEATPKVDAMNNEASPKDNHVQSIGNEGSSESADTRTTGSDDQKGPTNENAVTKAPPVPVPTLQEDSSATKYAPKDTTTPTAAPPDTSVTAQPSQISETGIPEATPALIDPASPWELSALGGILRTNTKYTSANSGSWNSDVQQQWSFNTGLELMHMGRNFGIGTGLHYGTYSERINAKAINSTLYDVTNFWYLDPVDTTIFSITGITIIDSTEYYTGISIDTTINVIRRGADSTSVTEEIRSAREIINKVSYLEIPLLLDGHVVQGRWTLGLRGGPTIGLLTTRKGTLPNNAGDGYTDLTDQPFREVVFGWTARAYVRYRFNAAWSIGVEPMIRGQFNSLNKGDLSRRASGLGGVLCISYRFR